MYAGTDWLAYVRREHPEEVAAHARELATKAGAWNRRTGELYWRRYMRRAVEELVPAAQALCRQRNQWPDAPALRPDGGALKRSVSDAA